MRVTCCHANAMMCTARNYMRHHFNRANAIYDEGLASLLLGISDLTSIKALDFS
jgi:hypothetical protein